LGGKVQSTELTRFTHGAPELQSIGKDTGNADALLEGGLEDGPTDRVVVEDKTYIFHYLNPGVWTVWHPLSLLPRGFVTVTLEGHKQDRALKNGELEFEFRHNGKVFRRFTVIGPEGPTFGIYIPRDNPLGDDGKPSPAFTEALGGLRHYVDSKAERIRTQLGTEPKVPTLYAAVTDCSGYGGKTAHMCGYGCRTADRDTMLAEYKILRMIGVNGIRGSPGFIRDMIHDREGLGPELSRAYLVHTIGYPIPMVGRADGRPPDVRPGNGCPSDPVNTAGIRDRVNTAVNTLLETVGELPVHEVWGLTVDEIGTVFDGAPEGKAHQGGCPHCRKAFREMIQADGRTLDDFGAKSWDDIRSTYGYWARSYWDVRREREAALKNARDSMANAQKAALNAGGTNLGGGDPDDEVVDQLDDVAGKKTERDHAQDLLDAKKSMEQLIWNPRAGQPNNDTQPIPLSEPGIRLLGYYSARFNNEAAARLFSPLRDALAAENRKKEQAIASGNLDAPEARQPWLYSYALRGNTFLMGGHSLDFFDFYRYADNGFMYETSNRDPRVWQWDSYLCDVGRSLNRHMGLRFGIYVKPHRGAPMQRALTAAARGVRLIFWYTYGPEWAKGDTWGARDWAVATVGRTANLLGQAEEVTYDSSWAMPVEVALVRPLTSKIFGNSANWENGKWIHAALTHAHIPVDALDEGLVLSEDLARYKVICVSGSHLRRDAAVKPVAALLARVHAHLDDERPLRLLDLSADEKAMLAEFTPLTAKPVLYVANIDESDLPGEDAAYVKTAARAAQEEEATVIPICAKWEEELK